MLRRAHRLTRNETTDLPQHFMVVDTETKATTDKTGQVIHKLWFGCAIYFTLPSGTKKKPKREIYFFQSVQEFWQWFALHLPARTRLIFSAHNLPFDFIVLDAFTELPKLGFQVDFPILGGIKFLTKAKRDGNSVWFVDSMNYLPTSLASIGHSIRLDKLKMPSLTDSFDQWMAYCQRDTEILEKFWRVLIAFMREHDLGSFAMTAASMAFNAFRHKHMRHEIFIHNMDDSLHLERLSYYGGRTECFQIGERIQQQYFMLDVNSMYPYVMRSNRFPVKLIRHGKALPLKQFDQTMLVYNVVATVGIETDKPVYPKRLDGKLMFPTGRFETTLADPELRYAMEHNHIRYIKEYSCYESAPIFESYIDEFYNLRLTYKQEGNDAFVLFTKLCLVSLYGKFGQRGHYREDVDQNPAIKFGQETFYSEKLGRISQTYYWYGHGWYEHEDGESFNSFPAIAACVTSAARLYVWGLIEIAGKENVLYTDTDSLICTREGLDHLASMQDRTELGKLKLEKQSEYLLLRGLKDYRFGATERIKGISTKAVRLTERTYQQLHFATFKESMRARRNDAVALTVVEKTLKRDYDKGVVDAFGFVSPFCLSEF